jgi:iron complex outermembrane recepter protein
MAEGMDMPGAAWSRTSFIFCFACFLCLIHLPVEAQVRFDLPAQSLSRSLTAIGGLANLNIYFDPPLVQDLQAPAINAELTADAALERLLAGTGLHIVRIDENTLRVIGELPSTRATIARQPDSGALYTPLSMRLTYADTESGQHVDAGSETPEEQAGQTRTQTDKKKNEPGALEEIVITGTNIRGVAPVGAPIHTLDRLDIERSGYTTTEQLIQSLPENFRGGVTGASADAIFSPGSNSGYNNSFGTGVNLRGLGNTATLVLVNGHRVASSGSGFFTDVSTIPVSAIDHIDVLTDGSSAIYGSDAIAGVVNIVLRKESQGIETGIRYGTTTYNGFSSDGANLQLGGNWEEGGATLGADFSHQGSLDASERPFTSSVSSPTSIFPASTQTAVTVAAHQHLGGRFELHTDAQYSTGRRNAWDAAADPAYLSIPHIDRWSGSAGGALQLSSSWTLGYDVSAGVGVDDTDTQHAVVADNDRIKLTSRFSEQNLTLSGDLITLPAGSTKLALGTDYRSERFSDQERPQSLPYFSYDVHRNVTSAFGELRVPLFSNQNALPGLQALTLSAAVRRDHYSDFGNTTNPKFGISWFPLDTLELRGAYSTSFRAPATGTELRNSKVGTTVVFVFAGPDQSQASPVPVVTFLGAQPNLQPETARNLTYGMDFKPSSVPGLQLLLNYYDISFSHQLAAPPFSFDALSDPALASVITRLPNSAMLEALVQSAIGNGAFYSDFTGGAFGPNPLAAAQYLYDDRIQNLSKTETSGFDFSARYALQIAGDQLDSRLDMTRIDRFSVELTPGSAPSSEVNAVGYPARTRLRGQESWTHHRLNLSIAANYVSGYPDTSATVPRNVGSFTTIDLVARYDLADAPLSIFNGLGVTLAVANLFDRLPPYVVSGAHSFVGSHYDPANADPLGRFITVAVVKRW